MLVTCPDGEIRTLNFQGKKDGKITGCINFRRKHISGTIVGNRFEINPEGKNAIVMLGVLEVKRKLLEASVGGTVNFGKNFATVKFNNICFGDLEKKLVEYGGLGLQVHSYYFSLKWSEGFVKRLGEIWIKI